MITPTRSAPTTSPRPAASINSFPTRAPVTPPTTTANAIGSNNIAEAGVTQFGNNTANGNVANAIGNGNETIAGQPISGGTANNNLANGFGNHNSTGAGFALLGSTANNNVANGFGSHNGTFAGGVLGPGSTANNNTAFGAGENSVSAAGQLAAINGSANNNRSLVFGNSSTANSGVSSGVVPTTTKVFFNSLSPNGTTLNGFSSRAIGNSKTVSHP
jgi:hypothetical protein